MKKGLMILSLSIVLLIYVFSTIDFGKLDIGDVTGSSTMGLSEVPKETSEPTQVYFCPRDGCGEKLAYMIMNSEKTHCALFDLGLQNVINALKEKQALVVVDNDNYNDDISFAKSDTSSQLSHNKFCIFDDSIVWTGSFNPTERGDTKNNNNVLVIYSKTLAVNYEAEFQELYKGVYGSGDKVKYPEVNLNGKSVENYFCPEDECAKQVVAKINDAKTSIRFMAFSFTHDGIGDALIEAHKRGVDVRGVMEKSQNNKWTEYDKLKNAGIDVKWDNNPYNMHHKTFIIDDEKVITGSFNPTSSGDTRNDENVIIVHDEAIAKEFLAEFDVVWNS